MLRRFSSEMGEVPPIISTSELEAALHEFHAASCSGELVSPAGKLVVIDVRSDAEIMATGSLHAEVEHIPLEDVLGGCLDLSPEDWDDRYDFDKPKTDAQLVFSCAAGVRSAYAAEVATAAGYTRVQNYLGGANEWFNR
jgi:rhodanese-related sulfurtransferase